MKTSQCHCIHFTQAHQEESEPIFELLFEALDDYRNGKRKGDTKCQHTTHPSIIGSR